MRVKLNALASRLHNIVHGSFLNIWMNFYYRIKWSWMFINEDQLICWIKVYTRCCLFNMNFAYKLHILTKIPTARISHHNIIDFKEEHNDIFTTATTFIA